MLFQSWPVWINLEFRSFECAKSCQVWISIGGLLKVYILFYDKLTLHYSESVFFKIS